MLNAEEINILGQIIDTTFGRQSSPKTSYTHSVTCRIVLVDMPDGIGYGASLKPDEEARKRQGPLGLMVSYTTIINYFSNEPYLNQKKTFEDEATQIVNNYIKKVREEFKDETGRTLDFEVKNYNDDVEILNTGAYNNKKTSYYRRKTLVSVE